MAKSEQLQIRVSAEEKARIQQRAIAAGMDVSKWVLRQVFPLAEEKFQALCEAVVASSVDRSYAFADINDFLARLYAREFLQAVRHPPEVDLAPFEANYLAAMITHTAAQKAAIVPHWIDTVQPLDTPWFASSLKSLSLHLLTNSPPAFRRRNLFIDSTVGDRI